MMRPPSETSVLPVQQPQQGNPFVCNLCKTSFSRIDHLSRHYRSHTNEKPFVCHICDKDFGRADLLKRHVAAHDEEKGSARKKQKTTPSANPRPRVSQACQACADAKLKCTQNKPCSRCQQKGIACDYPPPRIGKTIVDSNQSSLENYESQAEEVSTETSIHTHLDPNLTLSDTIEARESSLSNQQTMHEPFQLATPNTFGQDSIPSGSMDDINGLVDFDNSSLADFLRDIMMPITPTAEMRTFGDSNMPSYTPRDVLNFGVDTTSYELPVFDATFPLPIFDDPLPFMQAKQLDTYPQNSGSGTRTPDMRNAINLGALAFKESLWQWTPAQGDSGYAEQSSLSLPTEDLQVPKVWQAADGSLVQHRLDQRARDRVLGLILSTCEEGMFPRVVSSFPSTEFLSNLFLSFVVSHSNLVDPWIHLPTLQPNEIRPELLAIIVASGAVYSGDQTVRKLGFAIQEAIRLAVPKLFEADNRTTRSLQVVQTYALQLNIGLWSGDRRKMEMAESHHNPLITMIRRAGHLRRPKNPPVAPKSTDDAKTLDAKWRAWIEMESFKRLAFHLFIRDGQTSMSLLVPPLISYAEISIEMPYSKELWLAKTATEFRDIYLSKFNVPGERIPSLPLCIHDPAPLGRVQDVVDMRMSILIVLYGIWTLIWDYRQLNTVVKLHPTATHWNSGLITTSLHQEVCQLLRHFHLSASDWADGMQADTMLVYERSLLNLHVSFEDLQLFAGKEGEDEARRVYPLLRVWAESRDSRQAIWHAGQVLRAAKNFRPKGLRCFSAIGLYHASLALWAYAVVSNPLKKRSGSNSSARRGSSLANPVETSDTTLVWLDGEDGPTLQRFLALNKGTPAVRRWSSDNNETSHADSSDFAPLSAPHDVMEIVIDVLIKKSQGDDKTPPPLVKNLSQLMRSLGGAAKGVRRSP